VFELLEQHQEAEKKKTVAEKKAKEVAPVVVKSRVERPATAGTDHPRRWSQPGGSDRLLKSAMTDAVQSTSPQADRKRERADEPPLLSMRTAADNDGGLHLPRRRATEMEATGTAPADLTSLDRNVDLRALLGKRSTTGRADGGLATKRAARASDFITSSLAAAASSKGTWAQPSLLATSMGRALPRNRSRSTVAPPTRPAAADVILEEDEEAILDDDGAAAEALEDDAAVVPAPASAEDDAGRVRCKYFPKCLNPSCTFYHDPALLKRTAASSAP